MALSREDKIKKIELLKEKERRAKEASHLTQYESLYDWQHRFNAATATHRACLLMAANQVGKCVTYNTLIDTPSGQISVCELFEKVG